MRIPPIPALLVLGLAFLPACRPSSHQPAKDAADNSSSDQAAQDTPENSERQRMKGLGKTGWMAEIEVELLKEGETQEEWWSQYQGQIPISIVLDLDAEGNVSVNDQSFAPDRLRGWLADLVATVGPEDPVILRPKPATPLAALDRTAAAVLDSGKTSIYVMAASQLQRAHAVRLRGTSVRIAPNAEPPNPAPDSPR